MWAAALAAVLLPGPAQAFETFVLPNGLSVLLAPDHAVPVVTVAWAVPVGSRQEPPGRSGFAHLFEHLMFEGSAHVAKGRFDKTLEGLGADNNASTHQDHTFYYETLPSHALATALWLDADRLSAPAITEKGLRNQVEVVKEEKRLRIDNEPYMPLLWVEVASRSFVNRASAHDGMGSFAELEAARLADAKAFFDAHYAPRGVRLAVAGDFDPAAARARITRLFGWIPNKAVPEAVDTAEPVQAAALETRLRDAHASVPGVAVVWTGTPPRGSRESLALALVGRYLGTGDAARLRQALVKEARVATAVDEPMEGGLGFPNSSLDDYKEPGLFGFFILRRPEASAEKVLELVLAEAARVAREGVPPAALERVKARLSGETLRARQTGLGRAEAWLRAWVLDGRPEVADADAEAAMTISAEETQAAAAAFLTPARVNAFILDAGGK